MLEKKKKTKAGSLKRLIKLNKPIIRLQEKGQHNWKCYTIAGDNAKWYSHTEMPLYSSDSKKNTFIV